MKRFFAKARTDLGRKRGRHATQREIAHQLGFTDKLVGMWEAEVVAPPIARAQDIARVYGVEISVIYAEIAELAARVAAKRSRSNKPNKAAARPAVVRA